MPSATVTSSGPSSTPLALTITREKTGWFDIVVQDSDGVGYDLSDAVLWFHAVGYGLEIDKNSPASGIEIDNAEEGRAHLIIDPADTEDLPPQGSYVLPCELSLVTGSPVHTYQLAAGTLTITANVGTP